jgi:hypothetical protein
MDYIGILYTLKGQCLFTLIAKDCCEENGAAYYLPPDAKDIEEHGEFFIEGAADHLLPQVLTEADYS